MTFAHYDLLLDVIQHQHDRSRQPAYLRIVKREPRVRHSHGRPRSLPRGRPAGPPEAA
jgi:hypothetical protein